MTNLGQDEDRKRTYEGPHRQEVQFYPTFNYLPIHIRSCQSMSLFKRSSKLHFSSLMQ